MKNLYESFIRLKDFTVDTVKRFSDLLKAFSIKNITSLVKQEYNSTRSKLKDLKGTNWDLAQHHFTAGNFNDAIMRFKILQRSGYKVIESHYFLGRVYMEKGNYLNAKENLNCYLLSSNQDYREEAGYCLKVMNNEEIQSIPSSIIIQKRDRLALNLTSTKIDQGLLLRYYGILTALKSYIQPSSKVLELGCFLGIFGRILKQTFPDSIQYLSGTEIAPHSSDVAKSMHLDSAVAYDSIKLCTNITDLCDTDYSLIVVPEIMRYYGNPIPLLVSIFASLQKNGIGVIVARVDANDKSFNFSHAYLDDGNGQVKIVETAKDDNQEDKGMDEVKKGSFIGVIEEFSYSPHTFESAAKSCGFKVAMSAKMTNEFAIFILQKP